MSPAPRGERLASRAVVIGLVLGLVYWVGDAAVMTWLIQEGTFRAQLLAPDADDLWMRSFTAAVFLGGSLLVARKGDRNARLTTRIREDALGDREWRLRYEAAAQASCQILYDWDLETQVVLWDGWLEQILGYPPDEVDRTAAWWAERIHPEDVVVYAREIQRAIGARDAFDLEYRIRHRDGTYVHVADHAQLFHDSGGRFVRMVGFASDISAQHRDRRALEESRERLRRLSRTLEERREEERGRLAHEIHDELGAIATAIRMDLGWLRERLPAEDGDARARVDAAAELIESLHRSIRGIAQGLRPAVLDDLGLEAALAWLVRGFGGRNGMAVLLDWPPDAPELDSTSTTAVFRIAQEALTNASRYAAAERVEVRGAWCDDGFELVIQDDGCGLSDAEVSQTGFGILGMQERALAVGGTLVVSAGAAGGTRVRLSLPVELPHGRAP